MESFDLQVGSKDRAMMHKILESALDLAEQGHYIDLDFSPYSNCIQYSYGEKINGEWEFETIINFKDDNPNLLQDALESIESRIDQSKIGIKSNYQRMIGMTPEEIGKYICYGFGECEKCMFFEKCEGGFNAFVDWFKSTRRFIREDEKIEI